MKKNITFLLLLAGIVSFTQIASARYKKVLFIGNSYIYTNNMPEILAGLCTANNDTLEKDQNTIGGYTLQQHSTDATTESLINSNNWDVVIFQEQSQRPAFPPLLVSLDVYRYADTLNRKVKRHNSCSEVMFMMTWGYKNGDASNCNFYPDMCTYQGMQSRLRESYLEMGLNNNANVAPVGAAWKMARDSFPGMDLYSPDESHPNMNGSYLEACVLYASIYHKTPIGNSFTAGLSVTDATKLQVIAAEVTLDSLEQWQQYGNMALSNHTYTQSGNTITFQNLSKRATSYTWNFGDGNTSTMQDPVYTYAADGIYTVTLAAENNCNSEVSTSTINTYPDAVANIENLNATYVYLQDGRNYLKLDNKNGFNKVSVYDINGKEVISRRLAKGDDNILLQIAPGMYIYKLYGATLVTGKFSQQ
jgi:predicted RNase H-like HicB family nuclease